MGRRSNVKDLKSYKGLRSACFGKTGPFYTRNNVKVTAKTKTVVVPENVLNAEGKEMRMMKLDNLLNTFAIHLWSF